MFLLKAFPGQWVSLSHQHDKPFPYVSRFHAVPLTSSFSIAPKSTRVFSVLPSKPQIEFAKGTYLPCTAPFETQVFSLSMCNVCMLKNYCPSYKTIQTHIKSSLIKEYWDLCLMISQFECRSRKSTE